MQVPPGPFPYGNFYDTTTDMQDVLRNARASTRANSLKSLQQELRNLQYEYDQANIAELIWRCAVYEPDVEMLKALVLPGGIWHEMSHGCWTQLELPACLAHTRGSHSRLLLHAAVIRCSKESLHEVAALIVNQNRATLVYRDEAFQWNPVQLAIACRASHAVVNLLAPATEPSLWSVGLTQDATPVQFVDEMLRHSSMRQDMQMIRYCQDLHPKLVARSMEVRRAVEAERAQQEAKRQKKQRQQERVRQEAREREERIASARSFLEKMPEMLTSEPDSAKMMENLRTWVRVLVHADNMELLKADSALGTAYNKGLCKALLAAAVHSRSEAIPELMRVLRGIKWEELDIWPQLQAARVLLLQQGVEQGQPAAVQLMLQIDPSLVRQCSRPPLCAAVGSQKPLELVNLLMLPCKMYRSGLGVGELEKNASALAYAMLSGQHDVVKAIIPWTRLNTSFQVSYTEAAAQTNFSAEAKRSAALRLTAWVNTARPGPEHGATALYRAVELADADSAEILLALHGDALQIVSIGKDTTTTLHKAIEMGDSKFVFCCTELWVKDATREHATPVKVDVSCNGVTPLLWAVQCQQFVVALRLLHAGADPLHRSKHDGILSITPLTAVMDSIPAGNRSLQQAGLNLIRQMLQKAAMARAVPQALAAKADLLAAEKKMFPELGPALLYQAVSRLLFKIAFFFVDNGIDVTHCPADTFGTERVASPLLLLIEAAQEDGQDAQADANDGVFMVASDRRSFSVQEMLHAVLNTWSVSKTAKAVHSGMHPDDQQTILEWMLDHQDVTITKFAQSKSQQRKLVQLTIDAKSLGLLKMLVMGPGLKLSCSGCFLHNIVADAPLELLITLMKAAGTALTTQHPILKTYVIHEAAKAGRADVVKKLIELGVQVAAQDAAGNTPLHMAVKLKDEEERHMMVLVLLTAAPTLSLVANYSLAKQTPLDTIKHKKKLREWFVALEKEAKAAAGKNGSDEELEAHEDLHANSSDDEVENSNPLLLAMAEQSMEKRQRRISSLLEALPNNLKAAEAAEAVAAAAAKAKQMELPSPENVKPGGEYDGVNPLLDDLPTELPIKDALPAQQQGLNPEDKGAMPIDEDSLEGLPWEFIINKDARQEWARMDRPFREKVIKVLQRIGQGQWELDGSTERRLGDVRGLEVYRTRLTKGGRIVFEVAVEYSHTAHAYREMLRLWVITLDHDKYMHELENIAQCHNKSLQARDKLRLRAVTVAGAAASNLTARVPKMYEALGEQTDGQEDMLKAAPSVNVEIREHFPAASSSQDTYTLLKFYNLSKDLIKTLLQEIGEDEVDFPFRVSPSELTIIENDPDPPCSTVLVGRSGTGKTTCAVYKMWFRWLAFRHHSTEPFHQIFLTANPKLRSEVAKQFNKLRAAILRDLTESKRLEELSKQDYPSLADIPSDAFPLFWTTKQYLRAVDATLPATPLRDGPFFPRLEGGALVHAEHAHIEDMGGSESMIDMDAGFVDDEDSGDESDEEDLEDGPKQFEEAQGKKGLLGPNKEADYDFFVDVMWPKISTKEEKQRMTPNLVYQEICSFLKGSSEAMDSPDGKLSLDSYLEVGRKRAPNFTADTRREVYPIFEKYEREKLRLNRYDHMDLLFHIYRSLKGSGYQGVPIHNMTRDEVQDFTQAELLVDLRVMCEPNGLFCCGDPCQTIARGIVFRFADICTLFHQESQRRKVAGGVAAATMVGVPKKPLYLPTNYRTHSGILNAAAAVVDVLRHYFSMHIDNLPREKAFFTGPSPVLLSSLSSDDLTFLLLGSDPKTSQVEFGAHQVVLVRNAQSVDRLPEALRNSNVIKMTVAEAKGLEFDDVFLLDFFNDSPAEWRNLNNFVVDLEEIEEAQGWKKLPAASPLVNVEAAPADKGVLRVARADPDVLLCEELKQLYTALTRAKNNVIMFDSNMAKRAPFFNYLRRLGMAQYVSSSVMEDNTEDSKYVLTQGKNNPEDWVARGANFMDNKLYDHAAHCYRVAEDDVRRTVALAYARFSSLVRKKSRMTPAEYRLEYRQETFKIGHELLAAASQADRATIAVLVSDRKMWLRHAAKLFTQSSSTGCAIAARVFKELGSFGAAASACVGAEDFSGAAQNYEADAILLAASKPDVAEQQLQKAIGNYKKAKDHLQAFELPQRHPQLGPSMSQEKVDELAAVAMTVHHQQGDHDKALKAAGLIRSLSKREEKLRSYGYWKEVADMMQNNNEAARLLTEHGEVTAAVTRLMRPVAQAAKQGQQPGSEWADKDALLQLYTYCTNLNSEWALQQIAMVVDVQGADPYNGDGCMAKGRLLQLLGDSTRKDANQQFVVALAAYRERQELSSKHVQLMLEALAAASSQRTSIRANEALQDVEDFFGVKGLLAGAVKVTFKQHNTMMTQLVKEGVSPPTQSPGGANACVVPSLSLPASSSTAGPTLQVDRHVAVQAVGTALMRMVLPALLKMSRAAVSKALQDKQVRMSRSLASSSEDTADAVSHMGQAMKLIDMFGKVHEACQRLRLDMSQLEATSLPDVHQLRLTLCAHTVQLLVPISSVSDINSSVIEPFRRTAFSNGLKVNPSPGQISLQDVAVDVLANHALAGGSQNQNAGFAAWFYVTVLLQLVRPFQQESKHTCTRLLSTLSKEHLLKVDEVLKADFELLNNSHEVKVLDEMPTRAPGQALAIEAHLLLAETVGAVTVLGLGHHTFLPDVYLDNLEWSPLFGQAPRGAGPQGGRRTSTLKRWWADKGSVIKTLALASRIVRLLHNLMDTIIGNRTWFLQRNTLMNSVASASATSLPDEQDMLQESAAVRVATLGVALLTAFAVCSAADKEIKIKILTTATWRVVHLAEGCISDSGMLEALQACRRAAKVGELLQALRSVTFKLNSGVTQVSREKQVSFDVLPKPAPGLKTADPSVKLLHALSNAPCTRYTDEQLKPLDGGVRHMLQMPSKEELVQFSANFSAEAREAAAALAKLEADRERQQAELREGKIRWLRISRVCQGNVKRWKAEIGEQWRLQREAVEKAAALAQMEERRKQYQADAQQRLAWVEEGLKQRFIEDNSCPVCCANAGRQAGRRLAGGNGKEDEEDEEDDDAQPGGSNPFAALADLKGAVNAAEFVPHRLKQYHLDSVEAFEAYKQMYTDEVMPLLAGQKAVEAALQEAEPRAALDAEVGNKLHGCRFKLQESTKKLQECMNSLEAEHAWQDHTAQLTSLLELHQTVIQDAKSWLETSAATGTTFDAGLRPVTPGNQDATPWARQSRRLQALVATEVTPPPITMGSNTLEDLPLEALDKARQQLLSELSP
ncbi:hypothetical protein WJX79_008605 [Trebouxia sp. C0005]